MSHNRTAKEATKQEDLNSPTCKQCVTGLRRHHLLATDATCYPSPSTCPFSFQLSTASCHTNATSPPSHPLALPPAFPIHRVWPRFQHSINPATNANVYEGPAYTNTYPYIE